jgi:hypothetical protein
MPAVSGASASPGRCRQPDLTRPSPRASPTRSCTAWTAIGHVREIDWCGGKNVFATIRCKRSPGRGEAAGRGVGGRPACPRNRLVGRKQRQEPGEVMAEAGLGVDGERLSWRARPQGLEKEGLASPSSIPSLRSRGFGLRPELAPSDCSGLGKRNGPCSPTIFEIQDVSGLTERPFKGRPWRGQIQVTRMRLARITALARRPSPAWMASRLANDVDRAKAASRRRQRRRTARIRVAGPVPA